MSCINKNSVSMCVTVAISCMSLCPLQVLVVCSYIVAPVVCLHVRTCVPVSLSEPVERLLSRGALYLAYPVPSALPVSLSFCLPHKGPIHLRPSRQITH